MAKINPYLMLNGTAKAAAEFYQKVFNGTINNLLRYSDTGHELPESAKDYLVHANLSFEENTIMFSDALPGNEQIYGDQVTLAYVTHCPDQAAKIFNALKDGGQILMDLQETFFSPAFGSLKDKFGIIWQISTEKKEG